MNQEILESFLAVPTHGCTAIPPSTAQAPRLNPSVTACSTVHCVRTMKQRPTMQSRVWSCSELKDGNQDLMRVKKEKHTQEELDKKIKDGM